MSVFRFFSSDRSRFTPADERLMGDVARQLAPKGFRLERETAQGGDRFLVIAARTRTPAWEVRRRRDGTYRLQNGLAGVLLEGQSLQQVLLPDWQDSHSQEPNSAA